VDEYVYCVLGDMFRGIVGCYPVTWGLYTPLSCEITLCGVANIVNEVMIKRKKKLFIPPR
jgi:hypothetical protein